ncbi:ABC transporter permease [Sphingomonas sp. ID0503]|uniref:ABC transporter permease n=1 Tax=Sphingomonas sp. ID0503 TaxID=3399691 RepID=UPI003AFA4C28
MKLALRFALRDLTRGGRGLILLALCLFLGTAALAGIGSLSASMIAALDAEGRTIVGGDLEMRVSQRRATVEEAAAFAEHGRVSETITLRAMAEAENGAAPVLVDLKSVDAGWPLVGRLTAEPGAIAARPGGGRVMIARALADRLNVRVGDALRIGPARFHVGGLIAEEPDALGEGFSFGPRVLIDMAGLDATGLVQPGSLYASRYKIVLNRGERPVEVAETLKKAFPGAGWSSRTVEEGATSLKRGIGQLTQFLLLVGLSALAIAGIGVGSGVAGYLAGKTQMIATMKVLGAETRTIATMFLAELGVVGGAGIAAGLIVGAGIPAIVGALAGSALPVPPRLGIYPVPLLTAAALGGLVALLFALPALARARRVPAASLLRDALAERGRPSLLTLAGMAVIALGIAALAIGTAQDRKLAAWFVLAVVLLLGLLWAIGWGIRVLVARLPRPRRPLMRLAMGNLWRPGAQTERLTVALGLGFSLFVGIAAIDTSLSSEMTRSVPEKAPRFFAIDLQPADEPAFVAAVRGAAPAARIETTPSLRGAIVALKGQSVAEMKNLPEDAWVLRGDRTITWSATVPPRNAVAAGQWWPADYRGPPLVSLEDRAAESLGLKVGDEITVSVLGVDVTARIAALRKIDWRAMGLNFAIVFSPGLIEEAPHGLLAGVYAPAERDGAIARAVGAALPAVTLVRTGDVISQVGELIGRISLAVRVAGGVAVAAGVAVLIGAMASSAQSRRRESIVLKLLGGTRGQVLGAQAIEFALLAVVLSAVALGVGCAAGWYTITGLFDLGWAPGWGTIAATLGLAVLLTTGIGVLGSLPLLRARPAEALRDA